MAMAMRVAVVGVSWLSACASEPSVVVSRPPAGLGGPIEPIEPLVDGAGQAFAEAVAEYEAARSSGWTPSSCARAIARFEAIATRDPTLLGARFNVAVIEEECGDVVAAEAIYRELAVRGFAPARENLAVLQRARFVATFEFEDFAVAEQQILAAVALAESDRFALEDLAALYYENAATPGYGLLAEIAITESLQALERRGQPSADLWNLYGALLLQTDQQIAAREAFERAVAIEPKHADANRNLGQLALRVRRYTEAERALSVVLDSAEPPDVVLYLGLAAARLGQHDLDQSDAWVRAAIELAPADPRPWFQLARASLGRVYLAEDMDAFEHHYFEVESHCENFLELALDHPPPAPAVEWCVEQIAENQSWRSCDGAVSQLRYERMAELEREQEQQHRQRMLELEAAAESPSD